MVSLLLLCWCCTSCSASGAVHVGERLIYYRLRTCMCLAGALGMRQARPCYWSQTLRKQGECIFGNEKPVSLWAPGPQPTSARVAHVTSLRYISNIS